MSHSNKENIRFTFDCPMELHTIVKMKASSLKQSMRDYFINLLIKDATENPPKFLDNKTYKRELKKILDKDDELMRKLADR